MGIRTSGPERTRELELGFEASALSGRINVDFTYYNTRTVDALIDVRYAPSAGFLNEQLENVGELQNTGIELLLEGGILQLENVDWRARVNYTSINSEAIDLGGQPEIAIGDATVVRVGFPVPAFFGTKMLNPDAFAEPDPEQRGGVPRLDLSGRDHRHQLDSYALEAAQDRRAGRVPAGRLEHQLHRISERSARRVARLHSDSKEAGGRGDGRRIGHQ